MEAPSQLIKKVFCWQASRGVYGPYCLLKKGTHGSNKNLTNPTLVDAQVPERCPRVYGQYGIDRLFLSFRSKLRQNGAAFGTSPREEA